MVGKDLTIEQGQEAARYATLTTLAALAVAVAGESLVAEPATLTGSIGVFGGKLNIAGLLERDEDAEEQDGDESENAGMLAMSGS